MVKPIKNARPPEGKGCQAPSPNSGSAGLILCAKPALYVVKTDRPYAMCKDCCAKAVKYEAGVILQDGMKFTLATDDEARALPGDVRRNSKGDQVLTDVEENDEVTPEQLAKIIELSREQLRIKKRLEEATAIVNGIAAELDLNMHTDLPQAMRAVNLDKQPLGGGAEVILSKIVRASIPSQDKDPQKNENALLYMDEVAPDLAKTVISIEFGRGDEKDRDRMLRDLAKRKVPLTMTVKRTVHSGTLTKWVKDKDKAAEAVKEELLSMQRYDEAVVKLPKVAKVLQ